MPRPDPIGCALFLVAAFVLAGFAQTAWFGARASRIFDVPLDCGLTWRRRRLLGDNKTLRGFVVMLPAAALSFAGLASATHACGGSPPWPLPAADYAALGAWAALGFMLGELPNSFVKRRLGIAPGAAASTPAAAAIQLIVDRIDSGIGMLAALTVTVPVPALTWAVVLAAGAPVHWFFSVLMYRLGAKARPA
jgi:CDP-2,3-bis-(O-geranylgeranyl)-sn-glycerol synthase